MVTVEGMVVVTEDVVEEVGMVVVWVVLIEIVDVEDVVDWVDDVVGGVLDVGAVVGCEVVEEVMFTIISLL